MVARVVVALQLWRCPTRHGPAIDDHTERADRGETAAVRECTCGARSASLGRLDRAARAVPNRRLPAALVAAVGHPQGLRSPDVAVGTEGSGFALMAADHCVDVLAPYAVDVADLHRRQGSALDPVADRL